MEHRTVDTVSRVKVSGCGTVYCVRTVFFNCRRYAPAGAGCELHAVGLCSHPSKLSGCCFSVRRVACRKWWFASGKRQESKARNSGAHKLTRKQGCTDGRKQLVTKHTLVPGQVLHVRHRAGLPCSKWMSLCLNTCSHNHALPARCCTCAPAGSGGTTASRCAPCPPAWRLSGPTVACDSTAWAASPSAARVRPRAAAAAAAGSAATAAARTRTPARAATPAGHAGSCSTAARRCTSAAAGRAPTGGVGPPAAAPATVSVA